MIGILVTLLCVHRKSSTAFSRVREKPAKRWCFKLLTLLALYFFQQILSWVTFTFTLHTNHVQYTAEFRVFIIIIMAVHRNATKLSNYGDSSSSTAYPTSASFSIVRTKQPDSFPIFTNQAVSYSSYKANNNTNTNPPFPGKWLVPSRNGPLN